jgi:hypothetical protein
LKLKKNLNKTKNINQKKNAKSKQTNKTFEWNLKKIKNTFFFKNNTWHLTCFKTYTW